MVGEIMDSNTPSTSAFVPAGSSYNDDSDEMSMTADSEMYDSIAVKRCSHKRGTNATRSPQTCSAHKIFTLALLLLLIQLASFCSAIDMDICKQRSCYPETGDLLIGRKHRLSATSTCGVRGPQRYCIVSHLEDLTKCFMCDSRQEWMPHRDPNRLSHRIENVVTDSYELRNKKWWQSENGQQNVSIRLDLEAEFHFTHLIMTFKSFRPAAMVIERSSDFGKTWHVYRYFAYDCLSSYPDIPEGPAQNHSDIICTDRYSALSPATGGELIYKVLSPHIETKDPYSDEIVSLIKITNIRVNFTKLHTLGDDLLDYRPEIDEKYYYAVYNMVVRGSCSCYGHAQRCIPAEGDENEIINPRPDMVHGRCDCTHNTKGLNCEVCMDFYNDLPWRPATTTETNECRRCECNNHAASCHFDKAVYEASGFVSGGVCDDCRHNTQGKNCEECKPYFYKDPQRPITDPYACMPCQCDKAGSQNDGICEGEEDAEKNLMAGKCYCKQHVDGPRCDRCKDGYWNLSSDDPMGCKACTCFLQGTFNNEGCNKYTGECTCKRLVTGDNCDQCLPEHYGLGDDADGCHPCDCDFGGSQDNDCDVTTGQCKCRDHFTGRKCDTPASGYFCANIDYYTYEAETAQVTGGDIELRERPASLRQRGWTGVGYVRVRTGSSLVFEVTSLAQSMRYNIVVRYEAPNDQIGWEDVQIAIVRPGDPSPSGPCFGAGVNDDFLTLRLSPGGRYAETREAVCLEMGVDYEIRLTFGEKYAGSRDRGATIAIDSIVLAPPTDSMTIFKGSGINEYHRTEYERYQCRNIALSLTPIEDLSETCKKYLCPVAANIMNKGIECKCDPTGSTSGICSTTGGQCDCKVNVIGRSCDRCAPGTYGFGPSGCTACECNSVGALDNFCDGQSGQCKCRERGITGRQCNECQPGFWGFPNCQVCQCNDHASICDQKTGACIECRDLTSGHYCERCQDGYYGDPRLGVNIPCKPCPCPGGPASGFQHADTCYLQSAGDTQNIVCNCRSGYEGERCDRCSINHWGSPKEVGGSCERCDCNGNIDPRMEDSCDGETGECLLCLHNTEGIECENCISGYYGDAKLRQCQRCVCNQLGTNTSSGDCDRVAGQCPCLPNVIGQQCDQCADNHYNLASGEGCAACDCDPNGTIKDHEDKPVMQCNQIDGKCPCRQGRGGRTCSECEDYYWGDPTKECHRCQCDTYGSATQQCDRLTGTCVCRPGSGGALCNECARGYTGQWPRCEPCGECFQNWDEILQDLKRQTSDLIKNASEIEDTGVASQYDKDFEKMEATLAKVREQLESANITKEDVDQLRDRIDQLVQQVKTANDKLSTVDEKVTKTSAQVDEAEAELKSLKEDAEEVTKMAEELQEEATKLKEADVEGAYNITRESAERSMAAKRRAEQAEGKVAESESMRREAEELLDKNQEDFDKQFQENQAALEEIGGKVNDLETLMPQLNKDVCGAAGDPCDEICGGAGDCGNCGGTSCMAGSVTKAEKALEFAQSAEKMLEEKQKESEEILSRVRAALLETETAKQAAMQAFESAKAAAQQANNTKAQLQELLSKIDEFIEEKHASPAQIRVLSEEVLNMSISLTPEQIQDLAEQIREKLQNINDIDSILAETSGNLNIARQLKEEADLAKIRADTIENTTNAVRAALDAAQAAQEKARASIEEANEDINTARADLETVAVETTEAEVIAKSANESLANLDSELTKVKVDYVQIDELAKTAYNASNKAQMQASSAAEGRERLQSSYDEAEEKLTEKQGGNIEPQERAETLRQRATDLLQHTKKHLGDIEQEKKNFDANEVRLGEYATTLAGLNIRMDQCTKQVQERLEYFNTCG